MKPTPSLFVYEAGALEITCDLDKVAFMAKRENGSYWLRMVGGDSLNLPPEPGAAIRTAWIAYQGKFDPSKDR